jgi:putative FmdB family regulatory protein
MPLYEYQCKKCGHRFELIQSFSAEPVKECPICKGEVEKLISASSLQFKGSGFYSTDYAAKPAKSGASSDGASSSDAASGKPAASDGAAAPSEKSAPAKSEATSKPASTSKSTNE